MTRLAYLVKERKVKQALFLGNCTGMKFSSDGSKIVFDIEEMDFELGRKFKRRVELNYSDCSDVLRGCKFKQLK